MEWWILVVEIEDILIWKVCDLLIILMCYKGEDEIEECCID